MKTKAWHLPCGLGGSMSTAVTQQEWNWPRSQRCQSLLNLNIHSLHFSLNKIWQEHSAYPGENPWISNHIFESLRRATGFKLHTNRILRPCEEVKKDSDTLTSKMTMAQSRCQTQVQALTHSFYSARWMYHFIGGNFSTNDCFTMMNAAAPWKHTHIISKIDQDKRMGAWVCMDSRLKKTI